MGVNVGQFLRQAALQWPERVGVIDVAPPRSAGAMPPTNVAPPRSAGAMPPIYVGHSASARRELGYVELDLAARTLAARLIAHGVAPGDHVALVGENSAEFVSAWFAVVYAGCAIVPVPIASSPAELRARLEHARCRALLFDAPRKPLCDAALADASVRPILLELGSVETDHEALPEPLDTDASAAAMILYTSGTIGSPKAAVISHASLSLHTAALVHHSLALDGNDRVLGVLPLTHSYGCRMVMLASLFAGAKMVLVPRFEPARALELLREEAITWLPAVPTMFAAFAAQAPIAKLPALRWCLSAGAPLADETARRAEERLGVEIRQGYGMTEATFSAINAPPDVRVLGSVGKPVWGVRVRVVDAGGRELPRGTSGEVVVRGQNVMNGYLYDEPRSGDECDGFVKSGDVGRIDEDGRLFIVDRLKDLIIRGGFNVHPSEVEAVLVQHPDVLEAAVVGRSDPYYGEEVVALVIKREGATLDADSLLAFARERLSRTKWPRELAFLESFPHGPSGKVQKRVLRDWVRDGRIRAERAK